MAHKLFYFLCVVPALTACWWWSVSWLWEHRNDPENGND